MPAAQLHHFRYKFVSARTKGEVVHAFHKSAEQVHCIFHDFSLETHFSVYTSQAQSLVPVFEQCQGKVNE